MRRALRLLSGAVALTAASITLIAPAAMAAPKLADGCTFDQATGINTCTTAPVTTPGPSETLPGYHGDGNSTTTLAAKFCAASVTNYWTAFNSRDVPVTITSQLQQVTTTTYQGVAMVHPIATTTATTSTTYTITSGTLTCYSLAPGSNDPTPTDYTAPYSVTVQN